jgi:hypothetical protein
MSNYGYPYWGSMYGSSWAPNNQNSGPSQPYLGQSYVPTTNEWLPLPGADRSGLQPPRNFMVPQMNGNVMGTHPGLSPDKRGTIG